MAGIPSAAGRAHAAQARAARPDPQAKDDAWRSADEPVGAERVRVVRHRAAASSSPRSPSLCAAYAASLLRRDRRHRGLPLRLGVGPGRPASPTRCRIPNRRSWPGPRPAWRPTSWPHRSADRSSTARTSCVGRPRVRARFAGSAAPDPDSDATDAMPTRLRSQSCCVLAGSATKSCGCKFDDLELCNCLTCGRTLALAHSQRAQPFRAQPLGGGLLCEEELAQPSPPASRRSLWWRPRAVAAEPPTPATEGGGQTGGEITVAGCTPENPLIPGNTGRGLWRRHRRRHDVEAGGVQHRERRARERHRRVDRDQRQQDLHGQAEAVQVPRRHRSQGQELRRRLELHRLRTQRPRGQLLHGLDRGLRRRAVRPNEDCKRKPPRPRPCRA